ncbi:MAG: mechanosensitive ion channel [Thermoplasmatota archaeon]
MGDMLKKLGVLASLTAATVLLWFAALRYDWPYLEQGFYTLLVLTVLYCVLRILLEEAVITRITDAKTRYSFRKAVSLLFVVVFLVAAIRIWVTQTETLLVSYGLIAAGIAVALQDFFKNFVGGIVIFLTGMYRVGDRVEIADTTGDVIDIGILYTSLMETGGWLTGEQETGRIDMVPNGYVLSRTVNNYTKNNNFLWDELVLPVSYDSDWKQAVTVFTDIVREETTAAAEQAEREMKELGERYYLFRRSVEPAVFLTLTDNWITFHIRYVADARGRRGVRTRITRRILEHIQQSDVIQLATESLDITSFPWAERGKNML